MAENILRLVERSPGFSAESIDQLRSWANDWVEAIMSGEYGQPKSLIILFENQDGEIASMSQSLDKMDNARFCGLLLALLHRKLDGGAVIDGLRRG